MFLLSQTRCMGFRRHPLQGGRGTQATRLLPRLRQVHDAKDSEEDGSREARDTLIGRPNKITGANSGALHSTSMAGPEDAMRAESVYFELLGKARRYSVNGANLALSDDGNQTILTFTAR
ncbi:MAG: META domain-containing protein [Planctomycetes bacterium]|nr:META domain-containing protein [Planctomycetota bacterium]